MDFNEKNNTILISTSWEMVIMFGRYALRLNSLSNFQYIYTISMDRGPNPLNSFGDESYRLTQTTLLFIRVINYAESAK